MPSADRPREIIAARLRLAREMAGLSQAQAAKALGLHRPSVSEIEAGRRSVSAEELVKLAQMYGVAVSWLTGQESQDLTDARVELAARELARLKSKDVDRLLRLLTIMKGDDRP